MGRSLKNRNMGKVNKNWCHSTFFLPNQSIIAKTSITYNAMCQALF